MHQCDAHSDRGRPAAGSFTPTSAWAATRDRNGNDVIAGGISANAGAVTVLPGLRAPEPDPVETPKDYAIGEVARLASPGWRALNATASPADRPPRLDHRRVGWPPRNLPDAPQADSIVYRISKDGGKSWTPIQTALAGTPRGGIRSVSLILLSSLIEAPGRSSLFSVKSFDAGLFQSQLGTDPNARNILHAHVVEVADNGQTWVNPARSPIR